MNPQFGKKILEDGKISYSEGDGSVFDSVYANMRLGSSLVDPFVPNDPLVREAAGGGSNTGDNEDWDAPLVPSKFLERARAFRPKNPEATASSFSDWVYTLSYLVRLQKMGPMSKGLAAEWQILKRRQWEASARQFIRGPDSVFDAQGNLWKMVHCGLHDVDPEPGKAGLPLKYFKLPALSVNGEPLRASPDLVYRNMSNSDVHIVEIKFTERPIPTRLWPNVWAQLWVYAHIPVAREARQITVIGEIWGEWTSQRNRSRTVGLRSSVRRDPRRPEFDRFFRTLFEIYRGGAA